MSQLSFDFTALLEQLLYKTLTPCLHPKSVCNYDSCVNHIYCGWASEWEQMFEWALACKHFLHHEKCLPWRNPFHHQKTSYAPNSLLDFLAPDLAWKCLQEDFQQGVKCISIMQICCLSFPMQCYPLSFRERKWADNSRVVNTCKWQATPCSLTVKLSLKWSP